MCRSRCRRVPLHSATTSDTCSARDTTGHCRVWGLSNESLLLLFSSVCSLCSVRRDVSTIPTSTGVTSGGSGSGQSIPTGEWISAAAPTGAAAFCIRSSCILSYAGCESHSARVCVSGCVCVGCRCGATGGIPIPGRIPKDTRVRLERQNKNKPFEGEHVL